ncbi:hypothetical protein T265_10072 [Opisthorchis viverrini]|uniref:Uncharacterized protein n=1 Tax=Opisthorchis viverrini TaxID=6198 RepID=A0A074Z7Y7_OPIVI|nr:hypothetical protein T265_10072 [Opisthorchis viverrini]KER21652.1 hypothetical protein T265_10072 [Opisthorchis viverrini]
MLIRDELLCNCQRELPRFRLSSILRMMNDVIVSLRALLDNSQQESKVWQLAFRPQELTRCVPSHLVGGLRRLLGEERVTMVSCVRTSGVC